MTGSVLNPVDNFMSSSQVNADLLFNELSFDFGQNISLNAATTYWFGLIATGQPTLGWATNTPVSGYPMAASFNDGPWYSDANWNASLEFEGNFVPIPSAIWLLGSAFIGLVGFRKFRRQ